MLRDGKHIKEPPPEIGKYWMPQACVSDKTDEEQFMQEVLLERDRPPIWKTLLAKLLQS
jgi:hypothetical protein